MKKILPLIVLFFVTNSKTLPAKQWEVETRVEPKFPIEALTRAHEACISLQYFINANGEPVYIETTHSSTPELFDEAAINAIAQWRYKPTATNPNNLPERQTMILSFATSPDSMVADRCSTILTNESHDIELFRQTRLSAPIFATDMATWQSAVNKITTVLYEQEAQQFTQSFTELASRKLEQSLTQFQSLLNTVNGLNYHQIVALANISFDDENLEVNVEDDIFLDIATTEYPMIGIQEFVQTWDFRGMSVSMEPELYKEISYQLLNVELLIKADGKVQLLNACRKISDSIQKVLDESISSWQLTSKVKSPKAVRLIFGIPAPVQAGAYYHCDVGWYPEYFLETPKMKEGD